MGLFRKTDTIQDTKVPCLLNRRICNGRFLLDRKLGSGGYSVVYRAVDLKYPVPKGKTPRYFAIKCILTTNRPRNEREFDLHKRAAQLPGVVKFYGIFEERNLCFAVLEYCPAGDLFTCISQDNMLFGCERGIKKLFLQILDVVAGLHEMGIYHRDLKPENFLLSADMQSIRLADFGMATTSEFSTDYGCGSYSYMSPECLTGDFKDGMEGYSVRAADIWAVGVIFINMVAQRAPWKMATSTDTAFKAFTKRKDYLTSVFPISPETAAFCDAILRPHGQQLCLRKLCDVFHLIDSIYMSEAQLAKADAIARSIGATLPRKHVPLAIKNVDNLDAAIVEECEICDVGEIVESNDDSPDRKDNIGPRTKDNAETASMDSGKQSDMSDSSSAKSDVESMTDGSTSDSASEGPSTPETKPARFGFKAMKQLLSPVTEEPWGKSPWLTDAFRKKTQVEIESEATEHLEGIQRLVI